MSILKDAIDRIVDLANKSSVAHIVHLPGDPRNAYLVLNGELTPLAVPPTARSHHVYTVEDLVQAARSDFATKPALFHCDSKVELLLDSDDRRERVTLPLQIATTFAVLQDLEEKQQLFEPKALATLLKVDLAGTAYADEAIKALRKLRWRTASEIRQEFQPGRESLGKDVASEVTADVELPEYIEIEGPVYSNPGEDRTYPVKCILDPQPFVQRIAFRPVPGELEEALRLAQLSVRMKLQEALPEVPIFHGVA